MGQPLYDVVSREYKVCIESSDCSTFSKLHNLIGPPPLRGVSGPGRYGRKDHSPAQKERVRIHSLVPLRVAQVLDMLVAFVLPWVFETPAIAKNQVSIAHLDEYVALL